MRNLPKFLTYSCYTFISAIILASASCLYYYYSSGLLNGSSVANLHESDILFEETKKEKYLKEVSSLSENDKARMAVKKLEKFQKNIFKIESNLGKTEEGLRLSNSISQNRNNLLQLVSSPEMKSVRNIYLRKVLSFEAFVERNKWRTLTRMSKRLKARVQGLHKYNYLSLNSFVRSNLQDLSVMRNVTERSILSREDKTLIYLKLDALKVELSMISKFSSKLKYFSSKFTKILEDYDNWLRVVSPMIAEKRLNIQSKSTNFSLILLFLFSLSVISLISLILIFKNTEKKQLYKIEGQFERLLKEGILGEKDNILEGHNQEFQSSIRKTRSYVQKRMNFGLLFQEALPFPGLLLDSNLQTIWANDHFYDTWGLERKLEINETYSWDFLQRFTNLGENDPVHEALNQKVSGIYQIQLKRKGQNEAEPFEMYVSAFEQEGENRVMVFLYGLSSMEQTISDQATTLISPVNKALDAICEENFIGKNKELLEKDFSVAGTSEIFEKFQKLFEIQQMHKNNLCLEIDRLEKELNDKIQQFHLLHDEQIKSETINKNMKTGLNTLKEHVISGIQFSEDASRKGEALLREFRDSLKGFRYLYDETKKLTGNLSDGLDLVADLGSMRETFLGLSREIEDSRVKAQQSIGQTMVFLKSKNFDPSKLESSLSTIKNDLKNLDRSVTNFSSSIVKFDVKLSKAEILMENKEGSVNDSSLQKVNLEIDRSREVYEELNFELKKSFQDEQMTYDLFVQVLQKFVNELKNDSSINREKINLIELGMMGPGSMALERNEKSSGVISPEGII